MRRAVLLAALLPALAGGCRALVRDAETVAYRPGTPPTTAPAECDASYQLSAPDELRYWLQVDVPAGAAVGFRREPDGSLLAVAGEHVQPIPDGRYVWLCTPKPVSRWDRFAVGTRDRCEKAAVTALLYVTMPVWIPICCATGEWP
ncbi:MAG: hypothetical protein K2X82_25680 [Gemmataceae bacterium]|nr:hypothetical protein [Gemmataceae bacterium]